MVIKKLSTTKIRVSWVAWLKSCTGDRSNRHVHQLDLLTVVHC